jgi:hypothetical protein
VKAPPELGDNFRLICYTPIDQRHHFTDGCKQFVDGKKVGPMADLMICRCQTEDAFYLFGCDNNWNVITDTLHQFLEEAKEQAEFEYSGSTNTWIAA